MPKPIMKTFYILLSATLIALPACDKKDSPRPAPAKKAQSKKSEPQRTVDSSEQTQPPTNNATEAEAAQATSPNNSTVPVPTEATNDIEEAKRSMDQEASKLTTPVTEASSPSVAEVEASLPVPSPFDTFGGQLMMGYLEGRLTGEKVVTQTFDDNEFIMSNLAEMSLAVKELKNQNLYTADYQEKVHVLEDAMTRYLYYKKAKHENIEDAIEYGTAITLGIIAGANSGKIVDGLKNLGDSSLVQAPINGVKAGFNKLTGWFTGAREGIEATPGSVRTEAAEDAAAVASRTEANGAASIDPVGDEMAGAARPTTVVEGQGVSASTNSDDLYRSSVAYAASRSEPLANRDIVFHRIARVLSSKPLADGYRVSPVAAKNIEAVKDLTYHPTGIRGFRIHQSEGSERLIARLQNKEGNFEYFNVEGQAIRLLTKDGTEIVVPAVTMNNLAAARLRRSGEAFEEYGEKLKNGVTNSRAYQYAASDPKARNAIRATAVGGSVGLLTLLALRPLDTSYITFGRYVEDLEREGIHMEDFLDSQRAHAQSSIPNVAP